jgi:hypothetical protein
VDLTRRERPQIDPNTFGSGLRRFIAFVFEITISRPVVRRKTDVNDLSPDVLANDFAIVFAVSFSTQPNSVRI